MSTISSGPNQISSNLVFCLDGQTSNGYLKTPKQLSNCIAWFDASTSSEMVASSNIVTAWNDKSGNNYSFNSAQLSALPANNFSPLYTANAINGLGSLYFDGSNDYMFVNSGMGLANAVAYTSFVVLSPRYFNASQVAVGLQATSGTWEFFAYWAGLDDFRAGFDAGAVQVQTTSRNDNRPFINSTVRNGTSANAYINGFQYATITTVASTVNSGVARLGIGANTYANGSAPYKGYISEIIIYNRALSTTEVRQVERYLSKKWRIPLYQRTLTNIDLAYKRTITAPNNNVPITDGVYRLNPADASGSPKSSNFYATDPITYLSSLITYSITMEAWVKPNSFAFAGNNTDIGAIMICGGNFYLSIDGNGKFTAFMYGSSGNTSIHQPSTTSVTRHQWNHVVWTFDGSYIRWYLNGVLDKTSSIYSLGLLSISSYIGIGAESNSNYGRMLDGYVSDCKIYNRPLSATEVLKNYSESKTFYNNLPNIVTNGLQLYLDADVYSSYIGSGTTWTDLSGNSFNGTLSLGPTFSSSDPKCLNFDGVDDYSISSVLNIAASSTVTIWIRSANYNNKIPISINGDVYGSGPNIFFYNSTINWNIGDGGANPFTNSYYPDGNWHYIVVTNDASSDAKLYIDGVLIGTAAYINTVSSTTNNFWIGRFHGDNNYTIAANIAQVKLYTRALSDVEVLQNYNATKFRFGQ